MYKYLPLFSLAFAAASVQAGSWVAPSLHYSTDAVPASGYIYNVEQQQFLTKGGAWGNHASIGPAERAFLYEMQEQGNEEDGTAIYKLHCAAAANTGYLGRNSETEVYTDYKAGDWGLTWIFVKNEATGLYRIQSAPSCPNYGLTALDGVYAPYQLGWNPEGQDLTKGDGDPMGTNEGVYMVDPTQSAGWSLDWAFVSPDDYAAYAAARSLYDQLNLAEETGYTEAELADYAALLASTTATAEELQAATAAVKQLILDYGYNHATPDNPWDVTAAIQNPTFEGAKGTEPAGWTDEYGNMLIQNNSTYKGWDDEYGCETDDIQFSNFSQNWIKSNTDPIAASHIYQTLTDLPQGTYFLEAWCIATSGSADLTVSGCELYAQSGALHFGAEVANPFGADGSGLPHKYRVEVTHMGGDLTIGYKFTPGYVKWFGCDNFKLLYAGPVTNPGLVALNATVQGAQAYVDGFGDTYYYSEATYNALADALAAAGELVEGSAESDACMAEVTVVNDLLAQAKAEVTAYQTLQTLIQKMTADRDRYAASGMTALSETIATLIDQYQGAYDDKTATVDQVNEWNAAYTPMVQQAIKDAMATATEQNPVDVTELFENMGFEQNASETKTPAGWTSNSENFKARVHTAEVWNVSFDAYRTLENLPAGAYRLRANGLSRVGATQDNYDTQAPITAQMYAGDVYVALKSQALGATAEQVYSNDANVGTEDAPLYVPNSMEGARARFDRDDNPYTNELTAVIFNDNDPLRIGFRDNGTDGTVVANSWTIWSDVRVEYVGQSASALYVYLQQYIQQATDLLDRAAMITSASNKLNDAIGESEDLTAESGAAALEKAVGDLREAIAYANQGFALCEQIMTMYQTYADKATTVESDDTAFPDLLDAIGNAVSEELFESNEKIQEWLDALAPAWTAYIMYNHMGATKDAPEEVTDVIVNPSFDQGTNNTSGATGWTFEANTGNNGHIGYNNADQQAGSDYAFEFWKAAAFDMHQTVVGLPEGYYTLSANCLYRAGDNTDAVIAAYVADPAAARAMHLYANDRSVAAASVYDGAQATATEASGEAQVTIGDAQMYVPNTMISAGAYFTLGQYKSTINLFLPKGADLTLGLRLEGEAADNNWCVFDNFQLLYLGNGDENAPDAIQHVGIAAGRQAIFGTDGQRRARLQKGVNIIQTTREDGTVSISKVLVR